MKQKKIGYLWLVIVVSTVIVYLISRVAILPISGIVVLFGLVLLLTTVIFSSGLSIIKEGSSKKSWCGLLFGLSAMSMVFNFVIALFAKDSISVHIKDTIAIIVPISSFICMIFAILWEKFDNVK